MGIFFSRVKKINSVVQTLENLENDIKEIEESQMNAQKQFKKFTKLLLIYSLGLYVVYCIVFYFQFTTTSKGKLLYLMPLAILPLLFYIMKMFISWYFVNLTNQNQIRLREIKKEKKRILEEVMNKETYRVAKEIIEKFSCDSEIKTHSNAQLMAITKPEDELRKRIIKGTSSSFKSTPVQPFSNRTRGHIGSPACQSTFPSSTSLKSVPASITPMMQLPAPILPLHRSYVEKVVEYLIGDGVNNRYALICYQCHSHNGMALKEEFEYISFKCCYCFCYNVARKVRPEAPKLEESLTPRRISESDSEKTSGEGSNAEYKDLQGENLDEADISNLNNDVDLINLESATNKQQEKDF